MYIIFVQVKHTGGQNSNYLLSVAYWHFSGFTPRDTSKISIAYGGDRCCHGNARNHVIVHVLLCKFTFVTRGIEIRSIFARFVQQT